MANRTMPVPAVRYERDANGGELLYRLRFRYCEKGRLAMLSHLEVAHYLERVVRRAELPFAITNGFSPHMRISFGGALPVGVGGTCEIFDLLLYRDVDPQAALAAVQTASVPDLMPYGCERIDRRAKAASVAYPKSTYEVVFDRPVASLPVPATVEVVRKKKTRVLAPRDFLIEAPSFAGDTMILKLASKDTGSLRPDVLVRAMTADTDVRVASITRTALAE